MALSKKVHRPTQFKQRAGRRVRPGPTRRWWHTGGFLLVALLLAAVLALLAIAVPSIVEEFQHDLPVYTLTHSPRGGLDPNHARLHLDVVSLDEWAGTLTLRVSGTHVCQTACGWSDRLTFVATQQSQPGMEGLPPSVTLLLPATAKVVTETVTLPIEGAPLDYPFDRYHLALGLLFEQVFPDGTVQTLSPTEASRRLTLSLHNHVPGAIMDSPTILDPLAFTIPDSREHYAFAVHLDFQRPPYAEILAVLLVLLVAAAASYAVLLRPLAELVVNAGAMVLGVWGVRAILVGTTRPGTTGLDLALSLVILFLLGGVTVRMLHHLDRRSGLNLLQRQHLGGGGDQVREDSPAPDDSPPGER